jgi:nucleotide-binding universal stress UspA family protein
MAIRHILCAVDGSGPSLRAVALSTQIGKGMSALLTIISVRSYHIDRTAAAGVQTPEEIDSILSEALAAARQNQFLDAKTVKISARDAAVAIADYADEHDVGLIFVGSTGKDALQRFAFGSTSMDLLRKSDRPVTIVH